MVIICPVMYEAAGRQRKATIPDMSLGSPVRPAIVLGFVASIILLPSSRDSYNKNNTERSLE